MGMFLYLNMCTIPKYLQSKEFDKIRRDHYLPLKEIAIETYKQAIQFSDNPNENFDRFYEVTFNYNTSDVTNNFTLVQGGISVG